MQAHCSEEGYLSTTRVFYAVSLVLYYGHHWQDKSTPVDIINNSQHYNHGNENPVHNIMLILCTTKSKHYNRGNENPVHDIILICTTNQLWARTSQCMHETWKRHGHLIKSVTVYVSQFCHGLPAQVWLPFNYPSHIALGIHMWAGRLGRPGYKATTLKNLILEIICWMSSYEVNTVRQPVNWTSIKAHKCVNLPAQTLSICYATLKQL